MEQVKATRKESATQTGDAYNKASELRSQFMPAPATGKHLPIQIFAVSQLRQSPPPSVNKKGGEPGEINSILDSKSKKTAPPQAVPNKNLASLVPSQQQPAPSSEVARQAAAVPMFLGRMKDAADSKAEMVSTPNAVTNQSLERQMIDSGKHVQAMPGNAFTSALGRASAARNNASGSAEHLTNALIDYHTIYSLVHQGRVHDAQLVATYALDNIAKCSGTEPQLLPLVRAYVTLFQQTNMHSQAKAFQDKEQTFASQLSTTSAGLARNIWGA